MNSGHVNPIYRRATVSHAFNACATIMIRVIACAVGLVCSVSLAPLHAQSAVTLPRAEIKDQFDRAYTLATVAERAVLVFASDREGFDAMLTYASAARSALRTDVQTFARADLKGAPRLVRGMIRRGMPKDSTARVLLDWNGDLGPLLRPREDHLVAALFNPDGTLRRRIALPLKSIDTAAVFAMVRGR